MSTVTPTTNLNLNPLGLPNGNFPNANAINRFLGESRVANGLPYDNQQIDSVIAECFQNRAITCLELGTMTSTIRACLTGKVSKENLGVTAHWMGYALTQLASKTLNVGIPVFPTKAKLIEKIDQTGLSDTEKTRLKSWLSFFSSRPAMPPVLIHHYFNTIVLKTKNDQLQQDWIFTDHRAEAVITSIAQELYPTRPPVPTEATALPGSPIGQRRKISMGDEMAKKLATDTPAMPVAVAAACSIISKIYSTSEVPTPPCSPTSPSVPSASPAAPKPAASATPSTLKPTHKSSNSSDGSVKFSPPAITAHDLKSARMAQKKTQSQTLPQLLSSVAEGSKTSATQNANQDSK